MDPSMDINTFPTIVFTSVVEYLVLTVGIYKAVRLRLVNKLFNSEILFAICNKQVIDIDDPATPWVSERIHPSIKARIFLHRSLSGKGKQDSYVTTITSVNKAIDLLTQQTEEGRDKQHQIIAEAICTMHPHSIKRWQSSININTHIEAQNILSGAIVLGNLHLVKSLLDAPNTLAGVNFETPYFGRPLQLAAVWGHLHIVRYLIGRGANPRANSYDSEDDGSQNWRFDGMGSIDDKQRYYRKPRGSALRAAALGGHEDIVNLLLKPEYRLSIYKEEYFRAIMAAARGGHPNIWKLLIALTGKPLHRSIRLRDEIFWEATFHGREEVAQMVLDSGLDIDTKPRQEMYVSALDIAAARGDIRMVRFLLDRGASTEPSVRMAANPIKSAASGGHQEVVEMLLEHGANDEGVFEVATNRGQTRLVKWLLEKDPSSITMESRHGQYTVGVSALLCAIQIRNADIIALLADAGVSLKGMPDTVFIPHGAELPSSVWIVNLLISLGIVDLDPEKYNSYQWTSEEDNIQSQLMRRRVKISRRTWQWVGKH
ncbi:ankyrin repeat-containing domain protein [Daldinia decipiens]|uniref:ankyrin repeat-containing domain protein n=1 Tax=Daldinia decipiens TaxID=326647 RepID=UPI0020C2B8A8|nr:ankyrin repeat-containing domain protein [Daldinia decipiens]KAI1657664.1 ankyrin repeat-containing domain protein [Daldinia decipiens]